MAERPKHLELFYMPTCPYCRKVLAWMRDHDVEDITLFDIVSEPKNKDRLITEGGKHQVPCLFIDGKPLYESDDIIEYLSTIY